MDNSIANLVAGLTEGINTYLGKQQESALETNKLVTAQSMIEQRQKDLESQRSSDKLKNEQAMAGTKQALQADLDPTTADSIIPGGADWVNNFQKQNGRLPKLQEGMSALATMAKGQSAEASSEVKGANTLTKYQGMYNTDAKKEKDALDAVDTATQQIASAGKNPVAASSVPITLARMLTGTSRINVQEINALGGSQAILDRANKIAVQMSKGTLTDDNQKWMLDLANVLHRAHQSNLVNTGKLHAKQYGQVSKKGLPQAYKEIVGDEMPTDDHPVTQLGSAQPLSNEDPLGLLGKK